MTLAQAVETHLHHLRSERQLDGKTISNRSVTLSRLAAFMGPGAMVAGVTGETLRCFLADESGTGYSKRTVSIRRTGLAQFCTHMGRIGALPHGLVDAMPAVRCGRTLPKPASVSDIEAVVSSITGDSPFDLRDRAMVELAYSAGLRASEVIGLSIARMDLTLGEVRVTGKGGIERLAPVGQRACAAITAYLKHGRPLHAKHDHDTLFLNLHGGPMGRMGFWRMLKVRSKQAGLLKAIHPHMLRHSCATHMLEHGADLRVVQETLGHRSITSTQVYTLVTRSRLRAEHRKHHPRG